MKPHLKSQLLWTNLKKYFYNKEKKEVSITEFKFENGLDKHNLIVPFISQFNLVLKRFAYSFLQKIIFDKNLKKNKLSFQEVKNRLIKLQDKYNLNKYDFVYHILASNDTQDFIFLLNLIDYRLLDIQEMCYEYNVKIIKNITLLYFYINTILECDLLYYTSRWGKINTLHYIQNLFSEKEIYIIPKWIDLYFRKSEFRKLEKKYKYYPNDSLDENVIKIIKIEKIDELLKILFRYLYTFYALGKYANLEQSNIFTNNFFIPEDFIKIDN